MKGAPSCGEKRSDKSLGTTVVEVYAYDVTPDRTVYLIDTPGFDDIQKSDTEVLTEIASWLARSYSNRVYLHGIIYLHRITDIRMQGSAKKNLLMFKKLCGQDALKRVILVTSMWDRIPLEEGEKREKELINTEKFWGWMMTKGSKCHRHWNTVDSANKIVHELAKHMSPVTISLQKELVDENRSLNDTGAGQELQSELLKERENWTKQLQDIEKQMFEAIQQRDREAQEILREEREKMNRRIEDVEKETSSLRLTIQDLLAHGGEHEIRNRPKTIRKPRYAYDDGMIPVQSEQSQLQTMEKEKVPTDETHDPWSKEVVSLREAKKSTNAEEMKLYFNDITNIPKKDQDRIFANRRMHFVLALCDGLFVATSRECVAR